MRGLGQLIFGLLAAAGSSLMILAAASLALVEAEASVALTATPAPTLTRVMPSPMPGEPLLPTATLVLTARPTEYIPTACAIPDGWVLYVIQPGDTLESLAKRAKMPIEAFREANCLRPIPLIPNSILFMPSTGATGTATPPLPTPLPTLPSTLTPVPCGPPYGWVLYVVQRGDTIFGLSVRLGITQSALMHANCLTGTNIMAGQTLFVPFIPADLPTATKTPIPATATEQPSATDSPEPATQEPTATATIEPSATATVPTAEPTVAGTTPPSPNQTDTETPER